MTRTITVSDETYGQLVALARATIPEFDQAVLADPRVIALAARWAIDVGSRAMLERAGDPQPLQDWVGKLIDDAVAEELDRVFGKMTASG